MPYDALIAVAIDAGYDVARKREFPLTIQPDLPCPVLSEKIFRFAVPPNHHHHPPVPPHMRGVSRSSRTLVRDAVDAAALLTKGAKADGEVVWS